jgi:hypothetical protein
MISTDDRGADVLARRADACAAIDAVTVIAAADAQRASAGTTAVLGLASISMARSVVERAVASRHEPEGER